MDKNKALRMQRDILQALKETYSLLLAKMESEENNENKIYRLPVLVGNTADGTPLQVLLEFNFNEPTFQPLHSIYTYKEPAFDSSNGFEMEKQSLEALISLSKD